MERHEVQSVFLQLSVIFRVAYILQRRPWDKAAHSDGDDRPDQIFHGFRFFRTLKLRNVLSGNETVFCNSLLPRVERIDSRASKKHDPTETSTVLEL